MFSVYAIYNRVRNKIYIGYTLDLEKRIKRHNGILKNNKKAFTSKNKGKWELIYTEQLPTRKDAIKKEKELKSYKGREFIEVR